MRLDTFRNIADVIDLALMAVYIILYIEIFYTFLSELKERNDAYWRWRKFEIEYLTEVEKVQRNKKKPEFIRYLNVMLDGFTVINLCYTFLTTWSMIVYIKFSMERR